MENNVLYRNHSYKGNKPHWSSSKLTYPLSVSNHTVNTVIDKNGDEKIIVIGGSPSHTGTAVNFVNEGTYINENKIIWKSLNNLPVVRAFHKTINLNDNTLLVITGGTNNYPHNTTCYVGKYVNNSITWKNKQ